MDTDLGAAHAREKRLGVIRASAFVRISPFVVDALRQEAIVQGVPMRGFVGVNRGTELGLTSLLKQPHTPAPD